jgi:hypothetical protein
MANTAKTLKCNIPQVIRYSKHRLGCSEYVYRAPERLHLRIQLVKQRVVAIVPILHRNQHQPCSDPIVQHRRPSYDNRNNTRLLLG